jgi:hypothetical protein
MGLAAVGPCEACGEVGHAACREAHRAHCRGWGSIASERWASRASHAALVAGLTALVLPAAALVLLAALLVAWPLASREALRRLRRARGPLETSLRLMQLVALLSPLGWLCCPLWVLATARFDPDAPGAWRLWRPIDGTGEARGEVPRRDAARPNR